MQDSRSDPTPTPPRAGVLCSPRQCQDPKMVRQTLVIFTIAGLLAGSAEAASAQGVCSPRRSSYERSRALKRPYDVLMKDVASTVGSLRKNLDGGDLAAAAVDSKKLEALFRDVEDFWTPFKTKDAMDAAR